MMSAQSTPSPNVVVAIINLSVSLLLNSWSITSLISDVDPDVNMSTNLYLISVTGIPGGSVMFVFNCLFKDVNRLAHCKVFGKILLFWEHMCAI